MCLGGLRHGAEEADSDTRSPGLGSGWDFAGLRGLLETFCAPIHNPFGDPAKSQPRLLLGRRSAAKPRKLAARVRGPGLPPAGSATFCKIPKLPPPRFLHLSKGEIMIADEIARCHVESIVWHTMDSPYIEGTVVMMLCAPPGVSCFSGEN